MAAVINPPDTRCRVDPKIAEKAVNSLLKWRAKKQKAQVLERDEFVYLILTLKKIPQARTNPDKIPLPHPLIRPESDNSELCLIIDDRYKSGVTKDSAEKKIKGENISVSKVLKLSKLKSNYKLSDSYDMFFADKSVAHLLPKLLGKHFFTKSKLPVPVDLTHKNWKEQIDRVRSSGLLYLGKGTCSVIKIARVSMTIDEIVENVMSAVKGIGEIVPKKWRNVRSLHLKLLESLALPIYEAVPDLLLKIESGKDDAEKKKKEVEKMEKKNEVRYLDSNVLDEDELDWNSDEDKFDGDDDTDDETGEIVGKRRKNGHVMENLKEAKKKKTSLGKSKRLP